MKKCIPLTLNHIIDSNTSIYVRYRFYREFIDYQNCTLELGQPRVITTYMNMKKLQTKNQAVIGELLGLCSRTWSKYKNDIVQPLWTVRGEDEHFTLMPFEVFDMFMTWLDTVAATFNAKEALLKFYCYMYFHAGQFKMGYQQSQENIAIELGTTVKLVNQRLKLLRDAG